MLWNLTTSGISGTIQSASIQVDVTTTSTDTYNLYAMSTPWNESQVTFDQPSNTTQWQNVGANGPADYNSTVLGTLKPTATGLATITLNAAGIADLQAWLSNPSSNYGFVIKDASTSGSVSVTIASRKYPTVADRPSLSITTAGTGGGGSSGNQTITNPVTSATAAVNGTSGSPGYMSGIGLNLATLYYQYLQYQQSGSTSGFTPNLSQAGINAADISGSNVALYVTSESTTVSQLTSSLESLGMTVTLTSGTTITGWLPYSQLANAAILHGLVSAIPSTVATPDDMLVGDVSSRNCRQPWSPPSIRHRCEPPTASTCFRITGPARRSPSWMRTTTHPLSRTPTR